MVFPPQSKTQDRELVETSIESLLNEAKETKFDDPESVKLFAMRHSRRLTKSGTEHQVFTQDEVLNFLARNAELGKYRLFVQWAVKQYGGLLTCRSDGGWTPLLLAMRSKNDEFVECVLRYAENVPDHLVQQNAMKASCLHLAIHEKSDYTEEIISRILERPTSHGQPEGAAGYDDIFTRGHGTKNNSPLHMAVLCEDVIEGPIIDRALMSALSSSAKREGAGSALKAALHASGTGTPCDVPASPIVKHAPQRVGSTGTGTTEMNMGIRRTVSAHLDSATMPPPSKTAHPPAKSRDASFRVGPKRFHTLHVVKRLVDANPRVLVHGRDANGHTPFQALLHKLQDNHKAVFASLKTKASRDEKRLELIEQSCVLSFLRSYIIRNFSRRDAMGALYKVQDRRELEFDLSGFPFPVINLPFLEGLATVLRFEGILKYVALPRLTVAHEMAEDVVTKANVDVDTGRGVDHMCTIFDWLRKHHVRTILKLSVDDNVEPSHSDEMIEKCLDGFDVRNWNWYKLDLCCDVIAKVAPNVEDVTLYSSGSNAVLVGWSSEDGLLQLKQLKTVTVYVQDGLESRERLEGYMNKFKKKLERKNIRCTCIPRKLESTGHTKGPGEKEVGQYYSESGWIGTVQRFGRFLQDARPERPVQPIKIAIIDDGIDLSLDIFRGKIQEGHSFFQLSELTGHCGPFFVPMGKHGTLMAQLICSTCPVVKLYIAQLEVLRDGQGRRSFTVESAEDAIRWATDQGVDIISMSWSVSTPDNLPSMDDALKKAHESGIVMFCSSVDEDPSMVVNTYPGRATSRCLTIGAATALGGRLSWVAENKSNFLLPSEAPPMSMDQSVLWSQNAASDPYRGAFGSSVSTALAAGLAGVLLYCDRLLESDEPSPAPPYRGLDQPPGLQLPSQQQQKKKQMPQMVKNMFTVLSFGMDVNKFPRVATHMPKGPLIWNRRLDVDGTEQTKSKLRAFMGKLKVV